MLIVRIPPPNVVQSETAEPTERQMALPFGETPGARSSRTIAILARTIYRELRGSGFETRDVVALASELLGQVTAEVRSTGSVPPPSKP